MLMAPDAIDKINALLPDDVRVFGAYDRAYPVRVTLAECFFKGVHRVGRKFSAKDWCHARTYSYVLPTAVMAPRSPAPGASPFVFDTEARQRLNELLREYKGTHYFHNFTVKMEPKSSKSQRFIMDFSVRIIFEGLALDFCCKLFG
jgi:tRNA pseudouridine38-40 synthase